MLEDLKVLTNTIKNMEKEFTDKFKELEEKIAHLENRLQENEVVDTCKHAESYFGSMAGNNKKSKDEIEYDVNSVNE